MPLPKYRQLVADIREKIASGELAAGAQIPSTAELCAQYGVSATVVNQAVLILAADGLIEGVAGVGRFVRE